ncbi:MAG: hypothetical protein CVU11_05430 [Bacteroidetes bacterium HGW-Bacteroidetes-6]|jgi:hypothetical protein|nr:MAG: hypothetical protein CVU11_05430 [Bacteroidetes bacterium HGW-Bacteroidetes-6]
MKIAYIFFLIWGLTALSAGAQTNGAFIKFNEVIHDFGELTQGDKAEVEFVFTNTGDAPLLLSNVRSTCGCTVPTWPHDPILPKGSASIKVKYDSNRIGGINKQITVESNATNGVIYLKILGNISKKPEEIMPFQNFDGNGTPIAQ